MPDHSGAAITFASFGQKAFGRLLQRQSEMAYNLFQFFSSFSMEQHVFM
jgi:hypothetical protein